MDGAVELSVRVAGELPSLLARPDDEARRGERRRRGRRVSVVSFVAASEASTTAKHEGDPTLARAGGLEGLPPARLPEEHCDQRAEEGHGGQGEGGEEADEAAELVSPPLPLLLSCRRPANRIIQQRQRGVVAASLSGGHFFFSREEIGGPLWRREVSADWPS